MNTKTLLLAALLFFSIGAKSQDTIRVTHQYYVTVFSKSLKYPVLVEWWETKKRDECNSPIPRKDQFQPDPYLQRETNLQQYYKGQHIDRGHMCPAASNECFGEEALTECFYFSNMAPQYHQLNAGDWEALEKRTRSLADQYDSVKVWAGSVGTMKKMGPVSIPIQCWKVIYIKKTKTYEAYVFDNLPTKSKGLDHWKQDVSYVEKLTGFKF
jgi:endonuclease G